MDGLDVEVFRICDDGGRTVRRRRFFESGGIMEEVTLDSITLLPVSDVSVLKGRAARIAYRLLNVISSSWVSSGDLEIPGLLAGKEIGVFVLGEYAGDPDPFSGFKGECRWNYDNLKFNVTRSDNPDWSSVLSLRCIHNRSAKTLWKNRYRKVAVERICNNI